MPGKDGLSRGEALKAANQFIGVSGGYLGDFSYGSHADFYPEFCELPVLPAAQQLTTAVYDERMLNDVCFRWLMASERALLTTATLGNLNWCGERFSAIDVSTRPEFSHYTILDPQRGDFGWVAEIGKESIGVVWAQYLPPDDPGYGFLAEDTPEVSLWVRDDWRGRGLGRALLRRVQDDARARRVPQISLSVEADNYAKRLYLAEGFVDVPGHEADGVMAWSPRSR